MNKVPDNPIKNRKDGFTPLVVAAAFMVTSYITANVMAVKLITIFGITIFDAGTITFPIAYMLGDVLTEVWGYKTARKVIWLTFFCNIFFVVFTFLGLLLPSADYMADINNAYAVIFGYVPRVLIASLIGFLAGSMTNAWTMSRIKKKTEGRFLWLRTIVSSAVGYIFDTVLFVVIAFAGTSPVRDLISMIVIQYFAKLGIEALSGTPLAYGAIAYLKKKGYVLDNNIEND